MKNRDWRKNWILIVCTILVVLAAISISVFRPQFWQKIGNKTANLTVYLKGVVAPIDSMPTPSSEPLDSVGFLATLQTSAGTLAQQPSTTLTETPSVYQLPASKQLDAPAFNEKTDYQDWNNCGPATLALALRMWGWKGDQYTISEVVKPNRQDKNVNIEELEGFVDQNTRGLQSEFRVGGDETTIKKFLTAGFPVVVETSFKLTESFWPGDDRWAGHYLLITGYDDAEKVFTTQDSFYGPNKTVAYENLLSDWQAFNNVYFLIYPSTQKNQAQALFGPDWDPMSNRQRALQTTRTILQTDSNNPFVWFNIGSDLTYLEYYSEAVNAFQNALRFNLPERMLRYQFGPLKAAYEMKKLDDLDQWVTYALKVTPDSEELLMWEGRLYILQGDSHAGLLAFQKALEVHPGYEDAVKAIVALNTK